MVSTKETKVITSKQGDVKIVQPKHARPPHVKVLLQSDDVVREQVGGFVNFLREHAIVGLAVGFVIGTQVQAVVKQLVISFIDPLSKLLLGTNLSKDAMTIHWRHRTADFGWGAFVYTLIDFLLVVAVIYTIIKIFKLDKLDKPKG